MMANFILEGVYFYSGFMFFYNLARNGKMPEARRRSATSTATRTRTCGCSAT